MHKLDNLILEKFCNVLYKLKIGQPSLIIKAIFFNWEKDDDN